MKNILSKTLLGACLFMSASCSDQFLQDKRDYNNMVTQDVFKDPVQANAVFGTIYNYILGRYNSPLCGSDPLLRQDQSAGGKHYHLTEEIASGFVGSNIVGDGRYNGANDKKTKAGNHVDNPPYWNEPRSSKSYNDPAKYTLYPWVYIVNNFITEIDRSRSLYDNETFWNNLKGQAIFARAWMFFDAVRVWGGVPYYNTETDMAMPGDRSLRMTTAACVEKICADFEAAALLLPAKWDAENDGRFTSVAAKAMISRVRLYAASPVFNASWDAPSGARWDAALQASLAAEREANAAGYGTSVTDINSWDRAFYAYNGTFNPEAIIKVQKSDKTTTPGTTFNKWEGYIRPGVVASSTASGLPAPDQMITLFPMSSGKRPTASNGYDDEKFYKNRDPRFYRTFAFSGCTWEAPDANVPVWLYSYKKGTKDYRYTDGSASAESASKKSRAIVWKMYDPNTSVGGVATNGNDILEYRYVEILLNIAECYAAKGDAGNCISYLKKVRQRVGISATDNYGLGNITDKYALIEAVLYERSVELAYEGKRQWDMRRWLLYEGGAGFDPRLAGIDGMNKYNPETAWGMGWKLYNGQHGRNEYTKANNILTKLGLPRFSGTKHIGKIWVYDLGTTHNVDEKNHPLKDNAYLKAVPTITRGMDEAARQVALAKLDEFYDNTGMKTINPMVEELNEIGPKYGMDSGGSESQQNFLFSWRGWYYVYPIHYDAYTLGKGNDWLAQTEGWMIANKTPAGTSADEQDGTYIYCLPE